MGHQVLHFVWNDVVIAFEQPYGMISLMTGPLAGCFTGAPAAIIQMYWDNQLHAREPKRFPPGIVQVRVRVRVRVKVRVRVSSRVQAVSAWHRPGASPPPAATCTLHAHAR